MNRRSILGAALAACALPALPARAGMTQSEHGAMRRAGFYCHVWVDGVKQKYVVDVNQRDGWAEVARTDCPYGAPGEIYLLPVGRDWRTVREDDDVEWRLATERRYGIVTVEYFRRDQS